MVVTVASAHASTPATANALLAAAFRDADHATWVHEIQDFGVNGHFLQTMANVIGSTNGEQTTTFANGGTDTLIALDTQHRMYERANARGLLDYAITTDTARYANKWMVETPAYPGYGYNADATTIASDFDQFTMTGALTLGPVVTKDGHLVRAISGHTSKGAGGLPGSETLWVTASGPVLPFALRETSGHYELVASWSRWGSAVALVAPSPTVPYPAAASTTPTQAA